MTAKYSNLTEYHDYRGRRFAERCTSCGLCLEACPVFPLTKSARRGARAVMEKVTELLKGGEVSEEAYEMVFSCNGGCAACVPSCPEGLMLYAAFTPAIARIARAGRRLPLLSYQMTPGHRHNFPSVFSALQSSPAEVRWIRRAPANPEPVDVVFFTSCMPLGIPHVLLESVDILSSMGIDFVALAGNEVCCGSGPMLWGDMEASQEMSRDFISNIAAFKPKKAVFFCHGCHMMCSAILPRFMTLPFESCELIQFLVENLDRIPFKHRIDKRVAVHDNCAAARMGMYEATRTLLRAVPGITLVEMEHNRDNSLCCGGLTNVSRPEISEPMRRAPLKEASATGADIMTTICVGCLQSFAPLEHEYALEVRNYVSLVAESVGVRHQDRFKPLVDGRRPGEVLSDVGSRIEASNFSREEMEQALPEYLNRFCLRHGQSPR